MLPRGLRKEFRRSLPVAGGEALEERVQDIRPSLSSAECHRSMTGRQYVRQKRGVCSKDFLALVAFLTKQRRLLSVYVGKYSWDGLVSFSSARSSERNQLMFAK